jgi:hypothetical protein
MHERASIDDLKAYSPEDYLGELKKKMDSNDGEHIYPFFNNFHFLIPGSDPRSIENKLPFKDRQSHYEVQYQRYYDVQFKELVDDVVNGGHSQTKLDTTPRHFFKEIRDALEENRISIEEIARLQEEVYFHAGTKPELFDELFRKCYPVMRSMIKKGYNPIDLIA